METMDRSTKDAPQGAPLRSTCGTMPPVRPSSFKREFTTGFMTAGALVLLALLILVLCARWAGDHREPNHGVDVQIGTACVVTRGEPVSCA